MISFTSTDLTPDSQEMIPIIQYNSFNTCSVDGTSCTTEGYYSIASFGLVNTFAVIFAVSIVFVVFFRILKSPF